MTLHIHNSEAGRLAHELASRTGRNIEDIVLEALREQASLLPEKPETPSEKELDSWEKEIMEIAHRCAALPDYDMRTPDEILGYDEYGLPT